MRPYRMIIGRMGKIVNVQVETISRVGVTPWRVKKGYGVLFPNG